MGPIHEGGARGVVKMWVEPGPRGGAKTWSGARMWLSNGVEPGRGQDVGGALGGVKI